jgi:hypothetical protein
MVERSRSLHHPEGELDERIVGFYEELRARYPDFLPHAHDSSSGKSQPQFPVRSDRSGKIGGRHAGRMAGRPLHELDPVAIGIGKP